MITSGMHRRPFVVRHLVGMWHHIYWNVASYLLEYDIIIIGICCLIYWNMLLYLLEYVVIFIMHPRPPGKHIGIDS